MSKVGDTFAMPLGNGQFAIGQIIAKTRGPCLILICQERFAESELPSLDELARCVSSEPALLANSFDVLLESGDWKKLEHIPPALDKIKTPAFRNPIGGLPFSFTIESYDGWKRFAWPWEMFAPSHYSISAKGLENAVKAYFRRGEWDSARYDKLLYKNIVPFGKPRGRKPLAESPLGHLVLAKIMDNVLPMTRRDKYENPLNEALCNRGFGRITGGGTQLDQDRRAAWVGLDIELSNLEEALEFTRQKLRELGAPAGSVLTYRIGDEQKSIQIV